MRGLAYASGTHPSHPNGSRPTNCRSTIPDSSADPTHKAPDTPAPPKISGRGAANTSSAPGESGGAIAAESATTPIQISHGHDGRANPSLDPHEYRTAIARSRTAIAHSFGVENGCTPPGQHASGSAVNAMGISHRSAIAK